MPQDAVATVFMEEACSPKEAVCANGRSLAQSNSARHLGPTKSVKFDSEVRISGTFVHDGCESPDHPFQLTTDPRTTSKKSELNKSSRALQSCESRISLSAIPSPFEPFEDSDTIHIERLRASQIWESRPSFSDSASSVSHGQGLGRQSLDLETSEGRRILWQRAIRSILAGLTVSRQVRSSLQLQSWLLPRTASHTKSHGMYCNNN